VKFVGKNGGGGISMQLCHPCGLYYKHTTIVNYASTIVNRLEALLTEDARVTIYDRHVFIVQATACLSLDPQTGWLYNKTSCFE
jgi:hypothetical protein